MSTQSPEERAEEIVRGQRRTYMNFGDQVAFVTTAIREAVEAETLRIMTILQGAAEYAESQAETGPIGIRDEMATHAAALRIVENRVNSTKQTSPSSNAIRSRSEKP